MIFNIAESNAERVKKAFTATENPHTLPGYKKSAILKPRSRRASCVYEVNIIDNTCIVCTVIHEDTETTEAIIKLCQYTPVSIEVERGELFRNCSNYPYRTETNNRYLKKYDQIACIIHGAIKAGLLYDTEKPAEDPEPVKAANDTPKRRQTWRVECRSPRGTWTAYSEEQPTREDAARIMEEAETRHTLTPDGAPIFYRIAQIDKGPETAPENVKTDSAGDTTATPETAPTTNGSTPGEESPTAPENEPQRAAETPERPTDGETPAADHTTPPQATQGAGPDPGTTTGATPAEPGPVTDSGRTTAAKTTGAAPPGPNTPQEAPPSDYRTAQTGPPRHETTKAAQTTTRSNKGPPRAKQDDKTSRTSETRINTDYPRFSPKSGPKTNTRSGYMKLGMEFNLYSHRKL